MMRPGAKRRISSFRGQDEIEAAQPITRVLPKDVLPDVLGIATISARHES
jgi:hypothetical protein